MITYFTSELPPPCFFFHFRCCFKWKYMSMTYCVFLWRVLCHVKRTHCSLSYSRPSQLFFALGKFCFCLWHVCAVPARLVFQRVTCRDHWFDFSAVLVCSLSNCVLKRLMTPPSKLLGKAKTLGLVVFSIYLPFCQPVMPAEERLWAVGCFFYYW